MLVSGFAFNTKKDDIEDKLKQIEKDLEVRCKETFSLGLLASRGILEFHSVDEKSDFKKTLTEKKYTTTYGENQ
eukprot:10481255-Karenia_brevis.AAC.1